MSGAANDRGGLSPSARALLEAARDADGPTPRDRERVRRALAVAIAASAGTAGATVSAGAGAKALAGTASSAVGGASVGSGAAVGGAAVGGAAVGTGGAAAASGVAGAATVSLFTKVAIAVVAIGVGSSAIVAVNHYVAAPASESSVSAPTDAPALDAPAHETTGSHRTRESVSAPVEPASIEPASDAVSATDPVSAAPAAEPQRTIGAAPHASIAARRVRVSPVPPATTAPAESTVDAEYAALRDAIHYGATPTERLASVDAHAAQFAEGQLAGDRERARRRAVHDLCAEGPDAVARYLASHPSGTSAALLRETCASTTH